MTMFEWSIETWTLIIGAVSLLALFRPEWSALYKRYFSDLDMHPTGQIELAFGEFASQLAFQGTLRAIHHNQFVKNMEIYIEPKSTQKTNVLNWTIFRSTAANLDFATKQQQNTSIELASPFLVSIDEPNRFNIMFTNSQSIAHLKTDMAHLKQEWKKFLVSPQGPQLVNTVQGLGEAAGSVALEEFRKYLERNNDQTMIRVHSELERNVIWQPGSYCIEIQISTSRPSDVKRFRCEFDVTEKEYERIKNNAALILMNICGITPNINFEYAEMREFSRLSKSKLFTRRHARHGR